MESKFKKENLLIGFWSGLITKTYSKGHQPTFRSISWSYKLCICNNHNQNMVLVCEMYFHTICQINEDTTQCKIVVTVWEKVLTVPMVELVSTRVNLTSLLGSLRGGGEKHESFAGWKMSIQVPCSQTFYFSDEKKAVTVSLWSLHTISLQVLSLPEVVL